MNDEGRYPALFCCPRLATKRLTQQLVTETDPDGRFGCHGLDTEIVQRLHPWRFFNDARGAAGNQIPITVANRTGKVACIGVVDPIVEPIRRPDRTGA